MPYRVFHLALLLALLGTALGCSGESGRPREPAVERDDKLRGELLEMKKQDQAERTGEAAGEWNDRPRADRLRQIIEKHGWPTTRLVGKDGVSAAWLIAQHADFDVEFQEKVLGLMKAAPDTDPTELAFLTDRVAVNRDRPQTYGTQGGCVDGKAKAGRIADPEKVDERRAEVGLEPLAEYLKELGKSCVEEDVDGG